MLGRLVLFLSCALPATAWTLTNGQSGIASGSTTVATAAFSASLTNPSLIVVTVQWTSGNTLSGVTDTAGNTYVDSGAGLVTTSVGGQNVQVLYALNTHTTASNVVTATFSASNAFPRIVAGEWTGGATSTPVDVTSSIANQTVVSPGADALVITAGTTAVNGDLVVAGFGTINVNITAGTTPNAFSLVTAGSGGNAMEYFSQTSAGFIGPTAGDTSVGDHWCGIMATFKPAGQTGKVPSLLLLGIGK